MTLPLLQVAELGEQDEKLANIQFNFDKLAQLVIDTGGQTLKLRAGSATLTWAASDTSGDATVSHGLGSEPVAVIATSDFNTAYAAITVISKDATDFVLRGRDVAGTSRTGSNTVYWAAIG